MGTKKDVPEEAKIVLANLDKKTNEELRDILDGLYQEEREISFTRRVLHGKIDILRQELVERLKKDHEKGESVITGKDVDRLTEILSKGLR
ncbi:MAG: hypothetical protein ACE5E0_02495 [Terriglobia bacterium]